MSNEGYKIKDAVGIYFLTFTVVEWIDVFTRLEYALIIIESLKFCQKEKGLIIYAWCLMSNHIHLICSAQNSNLSDIVRDFKTYTSKAIIKSISQNESESRKNWMMWIFKSKGERNLRNMYTQFWKQDYHPIELHPFEGSFSIQKLNYIHNNPVIAGIVDFPEEYRFSSARNYMGNEGLIDVVIYE